MGASNDEQTIGYRYCLGMHMILCHGPVDKLVRIDFDSKSAWTGAAADQQIFINANDLFGGEEREGGVSGYVDVENGTNTQTQNSYLLGQLGSLVPAFRGVLGVVFRQVYLGLNPYLKRPAFWAQRIHVRQDGVAQWYDAKSDIGQDMNPAHIIRECITDPDWGMGYPETEIDDVSFTAAADKLYTEGLGISLLWDKSMEISEFIKEVLQHIEGSLYVDRTTGKFKLKLVRDDYVIGNLLVLDESNIEKINEFKRTALGELVNSVTIDYWDASTGEDNSITVQDIALAAQQQAIVSAKREYPGFTNGTTASKVASRTLKALSSPLASCTLYANRSASGLNVGDVFVLNWPRYGISQLVMRVANIELGELQKNQIKISAVEDVFATGSAIYAPPPSSGWTDPNNAPLPCPYHCVIEAPYWELCQRLGESQAQAVPSTSGYIVATAVRPTSDATNAKLMTNPTNTVYKDANNIDFCPTALLTQDITKMQTVLPIGAGIDLDIVKNGTYLIIDNEIMVVQSQGIGSVTVGRGCLDTVPALHASGTRVYFADVYLDTDKVEYATGETARIKILPKTAKGMLAEASATAQIVTIASRHAKPYPPGKFTLNTEYYPDWVAGDLDIALAWAHRDRLQQTASLIDTTASSIGPEVGTTYTLAIYNENGSVIRTQTGLTGTTYTYDSATELTDSGGLGRRNGKLRLTLKSVRSGIDSLQIQDHTVYRAGYGFNYGQMYGGK